jgi:hypothetical protein
VDRPSLAVTRLEPPPLRPRARTPLELQDAIESQRGQTDVPLLEEITPRLEPPTLALPFTIFPQRGLLTALFGGKPGLIDWSRLQQALHHLDDPGIGRRGAFEGTLHRFRRIDRVRSGNKWFGGRGRETAEDRLYAYRCQFPGRVSSREFEHSRSWIGMDYTVTLNWPEELAGVYRWRLTCDDGAVFQMDGLDVIDHDGHHSFRPKEGEVEIGPGAHTFRLAYILGPSSELGVLLHYYRVGGSGWEIFDIRPILEPPLSRLENPTGDDALRVDNIP